MPGGGKSTVGRHLARRLGFVFNDADVAIENTLRQSIRDFFELAGEARFREIEQEVLADLVQVGGSVLSTGGGAVLSPATRSALKAHCYVVYLRASPDELYRRLRHDTQRPLLQVADPLAQLRALHQARDGLYREVADFVLETGRPSVASLANLVLMQLESTGLVAHYSDHDLKS
jgi:shikimate kinase